MVRGECESAAQIERVMSRFCVEGVGWGVLGEEEDGDQDGDDNDNANEEAKYYFYIQSFFPIRPPTISNMVTLAHRLAIFHTKSAEKFQDLTANQCPRGTYFGYHVPTHNGHLAQDNIWTSTWEEYFTRNMKTMLDHDEKAGGPRSREVEELLSPLFDKVIPRLLRPMEMNGRKVQPVFCHGDLWAGNVGIREDGELVVFDPGCFWGHAECKIVHSKGGDRAINLHYLGILETTLIAYTTDDLRTLDEEQRNAYLQYGPPTYPEDDFEARIMLYHLCVLFPLFPIL